MAIKEYKKHSRVRLTKDFRAGEFDCPCLNPDCVKTLVDTGLCARLQAVRDVLDCPVKITSAFRCEFYQEALKARGYPTAKNLSQHSLGKAADIWTGKHKGRELEEAARKVGFRSVGVGQTFIHVDMRDDCDRCWDYGKDRS